MFPVSDLQEEILMSQEIPELVQEHPGLRQYQLIRGELFHPV